MRCGVQPVLSSRVRYRTSAGKFQRDITYTCKSAHSCPCCTPRILGKHRDQLLDLGAKHISGGGSVLFVVLTLPRQMDSLSLAYDRLQAHCERFRRKMRVIERRFNVQDSYRVFEEVFHPTKGWHPHVNMMWFLPSGLTKTVRESFTQALIEAWISADQSSHTRISRSAQSTQLLTAQSDVKSTVNYVLKHSYYSPTRQTSASLSGFDSSLQPWEVLDYALAGFPEWIRRWQEYELAMKGRHRIKHFQTKKMDS